MGRPYLGKAFKAETLGLTFKQKPWGDHIKEKSGKTRTLGGYGDHIKDKTGKTGTLGAYF